jgi:soluble lytic murein transglycosylase
LRRANGRHYHSRVKRRRLVLWTLLALIVVAVLLLWREKQRERRFYPEIAAAAERYDVDPLLVKAVVWRESNFQPAIRGRAGEIGLMQIQEIAAQEWADAEKNRTFEHEHCLDPGTNTLAGTFYLAKLLRRYRHTDNPIPYALADYNAGRSNLRKWNRGEASTNSAVFIEHIGFPMTQHYVRSVMRRHALYKNLRRAGW